MRFAGLCCRHCGRNAPSGHRRESPQHNPLCNILSPGADALQRQGVISSRSTLSFWDGIRRSRKLPQWLRGCANDAGLDTDLCRQDRGAGARPRPRTDAAGLLPGRWRVTIAHGAAANHRLWFMSTPPGRGRHPRQHVARWLPPASCSVMDIHQAYKKLAGPKPTETSVTLAFCAGHVRRSFYVFGQDEGADRRGNAAAHCRAL